MSNVFVLLLQCVVKARLQQYNEVLTVLGELKIVWLLNFNYMCARL